MSSKPKSNLEATMNKPLNRIGTLLAALFLCVAALPAVAGHGPGCRPGPRPGCRPAPHHVFRPAPPRHVYHHPCRPAPRHTYHGCGPSRGWYNAALVVDATLGVLDIATRTYAATQPQTVVYEQPQPQTVVYQQPQTVVYQTPQPQTVVYETTQPATQSIIYQPATATQTTVTTVPGGVTYQTIVR